MNTENRLTTSSNMTRSNNKNTTIAKNSQNRRLEIYSRVTISGSVQKRPAVTVAIS